MDTEDPEESTLDRKAERLYEQGGWFDTVEGKALIKAGKSRNTFIVRVPNGKEYLFRSMAELVRRFGLKNPDVHVNRKGQA